jgi:hypothetical protein
MFKVTHAFVIVFLAALSGCAVTRSEIQVSNPGASQPMTSSTAARTVLIRSITDERVFEDDSPDASVPSLGSGGVNKASAEVKARAIGRKRNGYGIAMGDVLLKEGQTVVGLTRDCVTTGLEQAGYRVASDPSEAGPSPLVLDVRIRKFWAWLQPGFWAVTVHAVIATELQFDGEQPRVIDVPTQQDHQFVTDGVWMQTVMQALKDYETQVANVTTVDDGRQATR